MQGKKFYDEIVPCFIGEYFWNITDNLYKYQEYEVWEALDKETQKEGFLKGKIKYRYDVFKEIDTLITGMVCRAISVEKISKRHWRENLEKVRKSGQQTTIEWVEWWERYQETYLTFREGSKTVEIHDEVYGKIVDYSLEWILQNKEIRRIEISEDGKKEIYIVGQLKERDKDIQYRVSTIPAIGCMENNLVEYKEMFNLKSKFESAVENIYKKVKNNPSWTDKQQTLICQKLMALGKTFDRKRLKIDEIRGNDAFL